MANSRSTLYLVAVIIAFTTASFGEDNLTIDLEDFLVTSDGIPPKSEVSDADFDSVRPQEFFVFRERDTGATVTIGEAAIDDEFASTVRLSLYYRMPNGDIRPSSCTGTVIHPNVVVTAAHCVVGPGARLEAYDINYGASLVSKQDYVRMIVRNRDVIVHREYQFKDGTDIALLRIRGSGLPEEKAPPAKLGRASSYANGYEFPIIAGWGRTVVSFSPFHMASPDRLLFAAAYYVSPPVTGDVEFRTERTVEIYGKEVTVGACYGDSGGPAYGAPDPSETEDLVLMGVTSRGEHPWVKDPKREGILCVAPGARTVFTSIPFARSSFIEPAMKAMGIDPSELRD